MAPFFLSNGSSNKTTRCRKNEPPKFQPLSLIGPIVYPAACRFMRALRASLTEYISVRPQGDLVGSSR